MEENLYIVLFVLVVATDITTGYLTIYPDETATVNRTDLHRFRCSTSLTHGIIYWKHKHLGAIRPAMVYDGTKLFNGYAESGRFTVDKDELTGRCDLVISKVELDDAGEFYCIDDDGRGQSATAKLDVLENLPDLKTKPEDLSTSVGKNARLRCATTYLDIPVYWKHRPIGSPEIKTVYYGEHGLQNGYRASGRFKVENDEVSGSYDLIISNILPSDAGTYTCIDNSGLGKSYSAELIVIDSDPVCSHNVHTDGISLGNSCGVGPDMVTLTCSTNFNGNIAPLVQWKHKVFPESNQHCSSSNNVTTCSIEVKATADLYWAFFICEIGSSSCRPKVDMSKYLYAYSTTEKKLISKSEVLNCSAHSTVPCTYQWERTDDFGTEVVSFNQLYRPPFPGSYACSAKCVIRDESCDIGVMTVEYGGNDESDIRDKSLEGTVIVLSIIIAIIILTAVTVMVIYFLRKNKKTSDADPRYTAHLLDSNDIITRVMSIALLGKKIYMIDKTCRDVSVYKDSPPYHFVEKIHLPKLNLKNPRNIASSNALNCLFINDLDVEGTVYKVSVSVSRISLKTDCYEAVPIIKNIKPDYAFSLRKDGCGVLIAKRGIIEMYDENGVFQDKIQTPQNELCSPPKQIIDLGGKYLQSFNNSDMKIYNTYGSVQQQFILPEFGHSLKQGGDDFYITTSQSGKIYFVRFPGGKIMSWNPEKDGNYLSSYTEVATLKQDVEKPGDFAQTLCIDEKSGKLLAITSYGEIHEIHYNKGGKQIKATNDRSTEKAQLLDG